MGDMYATEDVCCGSEGIYIIKSMALPTFRRAVRHHLLAPLNVYMEPQTTEPLNLANDVRGGADVVYIQQW